jgi:hypothetical protein
LIRTIFELLAYFDARDTINAAMICMQ